jgi:anaphase-promoting complex subunit 3
MRILMVLFLISALGMSRYGLGMVYYRTTKLDLAQWHFRKAIDINPSNAVLICCEGMVCVSPGRTILASDRVHWFKVYEQKKEYRLALAVYTRAVAAAPNSSLVMFRRARMLVELEHHDVSIAFLCDRPCCVFMDSLQEALQILLRLQDIIPEEANIPFMLAQVYRKLGQTTQSAQYMSIALDVEPKIAGAIRLAQRAGSIILDGLNPLPSGEQSMSMDADGG